MKKLTVTKKLLYTAIVLAVVVASLEGATRLVLREPEPLPSYEVIPASIGRYDEKLGWSLKPGVTGRSIRTGELIEYRINALGLRDDEATDAG